MRRTFSAHKFGTSLSLTGDTKGALARSGQLERSLAQYRQTLDADSQSADARFGYGLALARLRRFAEAREVLGEGARLYPEQSRFAEMVARVDAAALASPP